MAYILTINLGSTSTKIAAYENESLLAEKTIYHELKELKNKNGINGQYDMRRRALANWLKEAGLSETKFDAVVARGGFTRPIPGGVWQINDDMLQDLHSGKYGVHPCNLSARLAYDMFADDDIPCYIVDSPATDELDDISRVSGFAGIKRRSCVHALSQKTAARAAAAELGKEYSKAKLVVAHMGGGITVGAHLNGLIVDCNDGISGEGPFAPERSGQLPAMQLIDLCMGGKYTKEQLYRFVCGEGGMVSYLGSNDMREIEKKAKTDPKIALLVDAMCYQVAKEICSRAAALKSAPDAVVLTGGLAYSQYIVEQISQRISWLGKVIIYPGGDENLALAKGALRVLSGEENPKIYSKIQTGA